MAKLLRNSIIALSWHSAWSGTTLFPGSTTITDFPGDSFESIVLADKRVWFVDYYADWCPHCQVFAPVWERLAGERQDDSRLRFGAVDCAVYTDFCHEQGISAYPTLRAYHLPGFPESATRKGLDIPTSPIEGEVRAWIAEQVASLPSATPGRGKMTRGPALLPREQNSSTHVELSASATSARLRLIDAEVAVLYSLRQGVFLHALDGKLDGEALLDLLAWLNFLSVSLPSQRACEDMRKLADSVNITQIEANGILNRRDWLRILDGWSLDGLSPDVGIEPTSHWRACRTYTCGLWNLFHIVTTAPSQPAVSRRRLTDATIPSLAMVRVFVSRFFGCSDCARHFLDTYDSCRFGRCELQPSDNEGAALWLWRVHNAVTQRVAAEKGQAIPAAWPSLADCPRCWPNETAAAENVSLVQNGETRTVYTYLQNSYWQPSDEAAVQGNQSSFSISGKLVGFGFLLAAALLSVISCACCISKAKDADSHSESFLNRRGERDVESDVSE